MNVRKWVKAFYWMRCHKAFTIKVTIATGINWRYSVRMRKQTKLIRCCSTCSLIVPHTCCLSFCVLLRKYIYSMCWAQCPEFLRRWWWKRTSLDKFSLACFSCAKHPSPFHSVFCPLAVLAYAHSCRSRGVWRSKTSALTLTLEFILRKSTFPSSRLVGLPWGSAGEL